MKLCARRPLARRVRAVTSCQDGQDLSLPLLERDRLDALGLLNPVKGQEAFDEAVRVRDRDEGVASTAEKHHFRGVGGRVEPFSPASAKAAARALSPSIGVDPDSLLARAASSLFLTHDPCSVGRNSAGGVA